MRNHKLKRYFKNFAIVFTQQIIKDKKYQRSRYK